MATRSEFQYFKCVLQRVLRIIFLHQFNSKYFEKACRIDHNIENMTEYNQVDGHFDHLGQNLPLWKEIQTSSTSDIWIQ